MCNEDNDHEERIVILETIVKGGVNKEGQAVDGLMQTSRRHHIILVGDKETNTDGLVQAVQKLTRVAQIGFGVIITVEILLRIWPLLKH